MGTRIIHANRDPRGEGSPAWPSYDAENRAEMIFDEQSRIEIDPGSAIRIALDDLDPAPVM
jgi:carboxylesterase type B